MKMLRIFVSVLFAFMFPMSMFAQVGITNILVSTSSSYEVATDLQNGDRTYSDRSYEFSEVPIEFLGLAYIKTANQNDDLTSMTLSFDVDQNAIVNVTRDDRYTIKPDWLLDFTDSGQDLKILGYTHSIYQKSFPMGSIVLGANSHPNNVRNHTMYSVILMPDVDTCETKVSPIPLLWDANSESDIDFYNVYRSAESGVGYIDIGSIPQAVDPISTTDPDPQLINYYVVTAVNIDGLESDFSNELCVTLATSNVPSKGNPISIAITESQ